MDAKLPAECQVLVRKLLECASCCFHTADKKTLETHIQKAHLIKLSTRGHRGSQSSSRATKDTKSRGVKNSKNIQCSQCHFKSTHPEIIAWHTDNCHGEKPTVKIVSHEGNKNTYHCTICKTEHETLASIYSHMSSPHNINLPFSCDHCSKSFIRKDRLTTHKRTHSDVTFTCEVCPCKYKSKSGLKKHVETAHTAQQAVKCDICKRNYKSQHSLKSHKSRCHATNRPFTCNFCYKSFGQKSQLTQHNRSSHLSGYLDCKICRIRFTTYKQYNMHQYYAHKNQPKYEYNTSPNKKGYDCYPSDYYDPYDDYDGMDY